MDIRARCLRLPFIAATVILTLTTVSGAAASELLQTTSRIGDAGYEPNRNQRNARISLSHTFGSNQTPFWLHSNRDGLIPLNSRSNLLLSGEYHTSLLGATERSESAETLAHAGRTGRSGRARTGLDAGSYAGSNTGLRLDGGFRMDTRISDGENRFGFGELYLHFRVYGWQLSAGRFHDMIGLGSDGPLTTGSMMQSRNALQPFRLRLSTPDFLPVPLTERVVWFKARWSESVTTDDRYMDGARIHQKYLYVQVRPVAELRLTAGVVHNLMWGGIHPTRGRFHGTFRSWLNDVLAQPDREVFDNVTPLGNGLGAYEFGVDYRGRSWSAGAYRMFYIEDGESLRLPNPSNGTWIAWLDLHNPARPHRLVRYLTYEHVNTKKQEADPWDAYGRGSFYAHTMYRDGWVHHGQTLGTPLILIDPENLGEWSRILVNNIVLAHHIGVAGHLNERFSYQALATYSRNYGTCRDQTSGGGCRGTRESPIQEREGYVPFRELRRDRYSFLFRLAFPVWQASDRTYRASTDRATRTGSAGTGPVDVVSASAFDAATVSAPAGNAQNSGQRPTRNHRPGLHMHVSFAVDAGAFHSRPLFGVEAGVSLSL